ncbi:MAG TPA: cytochrome P450 [Bacillota bacterium]|nr:cytochrome P450 [Bacillota bacterium]
MHYREEIPVDHGVDNTFALMTEGYMYIPNRRRRFNSNIFSTRLMGGQKVICIAGEEATRLFYDNDKFQRQGAAPKRVLKTLFGKNGVQTLDGYAHKQRKALYRMLLEPRRMKQLLDITYDQWDIAIEQWKGKDQVQLLHEAEKIMCRIVCRWTEVPLWANELERRAHDLGSMIDAFGAIGPRHWRGRLARKRSEAWIRQVITRVRSGSLQVREDSLLHAFAWACDTEGMLLNPQSAAVELLNVLRPTVAVGRFVTYGAVAFHQFPETKKKFQTNDDAYRHMFIQEVRRYYPFGPFLGARVRRPFVWKGHAFKQGTLVLLDVYGAHHDPHIWKEPDIFKPERFRDWNSSPFDFLPQGGGDYMSGHRCPGEWVTTEVMKASLDALANQMAYDVPRQDLSYSLVRIPSLPKSRFIMENIRRK